MCVVCFILLFHSLISNILVLLLILFQVRLLLIQLNIMMPIISGLLQVNRPTLLISVISSTLRTTTFFRRLLVGFVLRFLGLVMR